MKGAMIGGRWGNERSCDRRGDGRKEGKRRRVGGERERERERGRCRGGIEAECSYVYYNECGGVVRGRRWEERECGGAVRGRRGEGGESVVGR